MAFNRIAVYGHRGFVGSRVVPALIASGAPITVLHRPSSDTSNLPEHVRKIEVDVLDEDALVDALQDIDIVISLVGDEGTDRQYGFVKAIPRTKVQLFSPSDFCLRYCEQGMRMPCMKAKAKVEKASKDAGIPTTVIHVGNFAEFTLSTTAVGVDLQNNILVYTGNSARERVTMCTKDYVAAAYVDIFTTRPIHTIQNRTITLSELAPTGMEIAAIMKEKNGRDPSITTRSLEKINQRIEDSLSKESNLAVPAYCRKMWGTGEMMKMLPDNLWEVEGYRKASLEDLVIGGKLDSYRTLPDHVLEYLRNML
ncbi:NmrA-like family protein [Aspergillus eucalypticola CBS 122712]|uniref:NmrA-like family protein n=1 Tax=Aspergillus eucalypticola (strain CBS 122712 / IBT 29274) TaxID=1448314 RepID=A0A317UL57_ASPEC|nr:NmrA-like family protein [Aspergillus eucalypticola CBS 122712]PWY62421.1 NmrA-like family protein [Aspergillus eucalypticola CBS 122712]